MAIRIGIGSSSLPRVWVASIGLSGDWVHKIIDLCARIQRQARHKQNELKLNANQVPKSGSRTINNDTIRSGITQLCILSYLENEQYAAANGSELELELKSESESETESALCNVLNRHPRRHQLELYLWPRHKTGPTSCRVGATASAMFLNEKRKKKNSGCEKNKIT